MVNSCAATRCARGICATFESQLLNGDLASQATLEPSRCLARIEVSRLDLRRPGVDPILAYARSTKANVLLALELDRRYANGGVRGYAVHPGVVVGTALTGSAGPDALRAMGLIDEAGVLRLREFERLRDHGHRITLTRPIGAIDSRIE